MYVLPDNIRQQTAMFSISKHVDTNIPQHQYLFQYTLSSEASGCRNHKPPKTDQNPSKEISLW